LVVNEASACGRPVIVSDTVGCCPDLVGDENGWVTNLDDQKQLADTLLRAYEARRNWGKMGEAGQKRVAKNTFSEMASGVIAALHFTRQD
jgi:glycosyltransferase involved in cell wall biosynthesis